MSNKSLVGFFLRATPLMMWVYLMPALIFMVPWINWIGSGSRSSLDIAFMSAPGNVFCLVGGITFLCNANTAAGWALPSRFPCAEFLVTRPLSRLRLCMVSLAIFYAIVIGPALLAFGIAAFNSDMRFARYDNPSPAEAARLAAYEKGFPSAYREEGEHFPVLVAPHGLLYVKAWQLVALILVAVALQALLLRRARRYWLDRILMQGLLWLFILPLLLFVFRRNFVTGILEASLFFFIQYLWLCLSAVLAIFVSMQVWSLRAAREIEVL